MTGEPGASYPLIHVDLVLLREDLSSGDRAGLGHEAAALRELRGVLSISEIEGAPASDFDLAFIFVIDSLANLDAFGTDARYIRFLQGGLAGAMRSFGGADVRLLGPPPEEGPFAACLAVAAGPQTYDWQVREALAAWTAPSGVGGLAIGERQRYRGVGFMSSQLPISRPGSGFEGFGIDFISGVRRTLS